MLEKNKIYQIDALKGLKQLDDNSIDVIITSVPYNKLGLKEGKFTKKGKTNKWVAQIEYDNNAQNDNMPEDEYQKWQIEILEECKRVLKPRGSIFYNHKNRIYKGKIVSPYEWLLKTSLNIRQEIIWDRGSTQNVNTCRYLPITELIFWLTKNDSVDFYRGKDLQYKNEVWRFPFKANTAHPAPYPIDLPNAVLDCIPPNEDGSPKLVLDPFMGSGTTAVSAINHGFDYIGFELFQQYIEMANKRIEEETKL